MKTKIVFLLSFSFSFYLLSSQVPQGFNYQAIARDGSGNPILNTPLPVTITIQSDSLAGTIFWKEIHSSVTTNRFGLFTLVIGKGVKQTASTAANFTDIDWTVTPKFIKTEILYQSELINMGSSRFWTVPYSMVAGKLGSSIEKLEVAGTTTSPEEALFEVKNKDNQTVFAVYNEGVRVYVDDGVATKKAKGGFAIGGFGTSKIESQEYFRVTRDSTRVYVNPLSKGSSAGFAIGGYGSGNNTVDNFMNVTPDNYFIGHLAGYSNKSGYNNVFLGNKAGYSNTTGYNNVMLGTSAGYSNIDGFSNTFIGNFAGLSNTSGFFNIFIGEQAGVSNTTASRNVFLGQLAGRYNTSGQANVFIGQQSGELNTTGSFNFFAGRNAGNFNTTGQLNTFLGINAGNGNTTGNDNVNLGGESGKLNSTGSNNVNLGTGAGYGNTNGNNNINIGHYTGVSLNSGSGNIFIGPGAGGGLANTSDKLFIENSYADADNALIYGDFATDNLKLNANVDIRNRLNFRNNGQVLYVNNKEALYFNGSQFSWGFDGTYNYFAKRVTIGEPAFNSSYMFYVNGAMFATTYGNPSDNRYKTNLEVMENVIPALHNIRPVYYNWNIDLYPEMNFDRGRQIGFVAQDIEPFFPEIVRTNENGYKSVDYGKMTVVLLQAINEQQEQIETQQKEINDLKNLVKTFITRESGEKK